jgi:branched-chain amino acid transport system substrate-binding protein
MNRFISFLFLFLLLILLPICSFSETVQLTMSVSPNDAGTCTPDSGVHSVESGTPITISATALEGYTFAQWKIEGDGSVTDFLAQSTEVVMQGNATVTAEFVSAIHVNLSIVTVPEDGGSVNLGTGLVQVDANQALTITATPAEDYYFVQWSLEGNGTIENEDYLTTSIQLFSDATLTAEFASTSNPVNLTMSCSPPEGGACTPPVGTQMVESNEAIEITAIASEGYHFIQWISSGDAVISDPYSATTSVVLNTDSTITASFVSVSDVALTMNITPAGIADTIPSIGSNTVERGASISISTPPVEHYYFLRWTIEGNGIIQDPYEQQTTLTLIEDSSITAEYAISNPVTLTLLVSPENMGTVTPGTGTHHVVAQSEIHVSASPSEGYSFVQWRKEGDCEIQDIYDPETIVTVNSDTTITAEFYLIQDLQPSDTIDSCGKYKYYGAGFPDFRDYKKCPYVPDLVLTDLNSPMYFEGTLKKNTDDLSLYLGVLAFPYKEKESKDYITITESIQYVQLLYDKISLNVSIATTYSNPRSRRKILDSSSGDIQQIELFDRKEVKVESKLSYLCLLNQISSNSLSGYISSCFTYKYFESIQSALFTIEKDIHNLFLGNHIKTNQQTNDSSAKTLHTQQNTIRIGALFPLTGSFSSEGQAYMAAVRKAAEDVNDWFVQEGIDSQVEVQGYDTRLNAGYAYQGLESFIQEGRKIVIGPALSSSAYVLLDRANQSDTLLLSPTSTAAELSIANDNLMRLMYDDTAQSRAVCDKMIDDGIQHVLILTRGDLYGRGLADSVTHNFQTRGGTVISTYYIDTEISYSDMLEDLQTYIEQNLSASTAILLISLEEGIDILTGAADYEILRGIRWYGCDGLAQNTALLNDSIAAEFAADTQFTCSTVSLPMTTASENVVTELQEELGYQPSSFAILAYDACAVAAMALHTSSGSISSIKDEIANTTNHNLCVTNPIKFNFAGDRSGGTYDFWQVTKENQTYQWIKQYTWTETDPSLIDLWIEH